MHDRGDADGSVVPKDLSNKGEGRRLDRRHPEAEPAERGEEREPIKGNALQTAATRTQSRTDRVERTGGRAKKGTLGQACDGSPPCCTT